MRKLCPGYFATKHQARAIEFFNKKEYESAILEYTEAVRLKPKNPAFLTLRALAYLGKNEYDLALQDCNESLQLDPDQIVALQTRGKIYATQKEYDLAIGSYDKALQLNALSVEAFMRRGMAYADKRDYDRAIREYDDALFIWQKTQKPGEAASPDFVAARIFRLRGMAHGSKSKYDRALQDYEESIRLYLKSPKSFFLRGIAFHMKAQFDHAISACDEAIRLDPDFGIAYRIRGQAYWGGGNPAAASKDFLHYLSLNTLDAYGVLWLHLVREKLTPGSHNNDELATNAAKLDQSKWPFHLISFYLGQISANQLRAIAARDDTPATSTFSTPQEREAETAFYLGEAALFRGDLAEAISLLSLAANCDFNYFEKPQAAAELERIDAQRP